MLSKINRFHGHNSVRRAYKQGRSVRSGDMSLHVHTDPRIKNTKAAVVVSKKVHKSAVKRNRIRRRAYEIIRHSLVDIKQPADIVLTVYKPEIVDMPHDQFKKGIETLLKKSQLL